MIPHVLADPSPIRFGLGIGQRDEEGNATQTLEREKEIEGVRKVQFARLKGVGIKTQPALVVCRRLLMPQARHARHQPRC